MLNKERPWAIQLTRLTSALTLLSFVSQFALAPNFAWAIQDQTGDAKAFDAKKIKGQLSCNLKDDDDKGEHADNENTPNSVAKFCAMVVDAQNNPDPKFCVNHGVPIDVSTMKDENKKPVDAKKCNVPMFDRENCADVNKKMLQCKYYGAGQVLSQCMAYRAADGVNKWEWPLIALDLAAVAACGTACAMTFVNPASVAAAYACTVTGGLASVGEFIDNTKTQHSAVAHILEGTLQATAAAGATASTALAAGRTTSAEVDKLKQTTTVVGDESSQTTTVDEVTGKSLGTDVDKAGGQSSTSQKVIACATAALYAVMTGLRLNDINNQDKAKEAACAAVQDLASQAASVDPAGAPDVNYGNTPPGGGSGSGGGGPNGSGGGNGSAGDANMPGGVAQSQCTTSNVSTGCAGGNSGSGAATDAGFLNRTGLDKTLQPVASQYNPSDLKRAAAQGGAAGLIGAAGGDLGSLGATLAAAAKESQELPGGGGGLNGGYSGGGGSGGGGGKSGGGDNPFASLFGGAKDAGARGPTSEQFGKEKVMDIWHTGTTQNIFEIISTKVSKVVGRVVGK